MGIDSILVSCLCSELSGELCGGKIEKIQQPDKNLILLSVRRDKATKKLLLSAAPGTARVCLTERSFENVSQAPAFCMLLRKYLTGARIISITQPPYDRILEFAIEAYDDLRTPSSRRMIIELLGNAANVILVDDSGRIIDALRKSGFNEKCTRTIMPGIFYEAPRPPAKRHLLNYTEAELDALFASADRSIPLDTFLTAYISGISPLVCRELCYRSGNSYDNLKDAVEALTECIQRSELSPVALYSDTGITDYTYLNIQQYSDVRNVSFGSYSELLDTYYENAESVAIRQTRSRSLLKSVRNLRDRQQRKIASQKIELSDTENREALRQSAELILANIYKIKKGDKTVICQNYYNEDYADISITLDVELTPQQNAEKLFREYNRKKSASEHLQVIIEEGERKLEYLNSVLTEIDSAQTEADIVLIRQELEETGILRAGSGKEARKKKYLKPARPVSVVSIDGYEILIGRNNLQNDELTFHDAQRNDLWFHVQHGHGSHVIVRCNDEIPPDSTILEAARQAAIHSSFSSAGKVIVDYTKIRNVRKPAGAFPGKAVYSDYKSIVVEI